MKSLKDYLFFICVNFQAALFEIENGSQ